MLDFNNILATPGADIQYFSGPATTTLRQWQTWRKPRGARWIHLLGVGGGGGGGTGFTTGAGGGGCGGSSGGQTTVMIPAMFVPDTLYIQAGAGGAGAPAGSGATLGTAGLITYVCLVPYSTISPAGTLLLANGGAVGAAVPTATFGGTAPAAVAAATIAGMCLAGRGFYTLLAGHAGIAGANAGANGGGMSVPTTGLMVTGGTGGGGGSAGATGGTGGEIFPISNMLGTDFFALPVPGTGAFGSTPATSAGSGVVSRNFLFNFGGTGGGGGTNDAAGVASAGGDGAPGCGGGGAGCTGSGAVSIPRGGNGGPGFVYIITT